MFKDKSRYQRSTLDNKDKSKQLNYYNTKNKQKIILSDVVNKKGIIKRRFLDESSSSEEEKTMRNINIFGSQTVFKPNTLIRQNQSHSLKTKNTMTVNKKQIVLKRQNTEQSDSDLDFNFNFNDNQSLSSQSSKSIKKQNSLIINEKITKEKYVFKNNQQPKQISKCIQIQEYTIFEQLIISRRNMKNTYFQKQDSSKINSILSKIICPQEKQSQKLSLFNKYLRRSRENYKFKVCGCPKKHTILYYFQSQVPTIKQKTKLIFQNGGLQKQLSCQGIAKKINQLGYSWAFMRKQIYNYLQISQHDNISEKQIFKSHNFSLNKTETNSMQRNKKFNFKCCFSQNQYTKLERNAILFLSSSQQDPKDKIMKTLELKTIIQKFKSNKKRALQSLINKFRDFSIKQCNCQQKRLRLFFKDFIVPSFTQKQEIIRYYITKTSSKQNIDIMRYILKKATQLGYNWKYLCTDVNVALQQIKKYKSLNYIATTQGIVQLLKIQPQEQQQPYQQKIQQSSQPQFKNQQQSISTVISPLKPPQQQINQSRNRILKKVRTTKNIPYETSKILRRNQFINKQRQ